MLASNIRRVAPTSVIRGCIFAWSLLLPAATLIGQKLNFINYSVEQGLAQSQAQHIIQDDYGLIWIATLGGVSRFDGKEFITYDKGNGLNSVFNYCLLPQKSKGLWIGGQEGLQLFDGRTFTSFRIRDTTAGKPIIKLIPDGADGIYALSADGSLYHSGSEFLEKMVTLGDQAPGYLARDTTGTPYTCSSLGVYNLKEARLSIRNKTLGDGIHISKVYFDSGNNPWLITNKGLYTRRKEKFTRVLLPDTIGPVLKCIHEDSKRRIWVGTTRGAYLIQPTGSVGYIGAGSGFTDNTVNEIMSDRENNLWFATDADGIFKLPVTALERFDRTNGLPGNIVMGLVKDRSGQTWVGTLDGGLARFGNGRFEKYPFPPKSGAAPKITVLYSDSRAVLWLGTLGGGLWSLENGKFVKFPASGSNLVSDITSITETSGGTMWVTSSSGAYILKGGELEKIHGIEVPCFSVFQKSRDTLWVGSSTGLWEVVGTAGAYKRRLGSYSLGTVNCISRFNRFILIGTAENGLLFWDPVSKKGIPCTSSHGLSSNFIFSLYSLDATTLLAGTGKGISKIRFDSIMDDFRVKNITSSTNPFGPECNLNAVLKSQEGKVWFGTTRGITIYHTDTVPAPEASPLIYLRSVDLFSHNVADGILKDTVNAWSVLPRDLVLSHDQNHITFDFTGVFFSNPEGLKYQYRLTGIDTAYYGPVRESKIIYPNLSPGNYRFQAVALTEDMVPSGNEINFPFTIESPYYQRTWFKFMIAFLLIGCGFFLQYLRIFYRGKRALANRRIRVEEQRKILERTSEDLHDDLGNKITRITVLTDVLQQKIDASDLEKTKLINQIRENAEALYLGTKDIIWSLTPGNDNLFDTLEKGRLLGTQIFEDTGIEFEAKGISEAFSAIPVPLAISRNLNMIIKESFSNILKHSQAGCAAMSVEYGPDHVLRISVMDDGKGLDPGMAHTGNGLKNMYKRMERIGGSICTTGNEGGGLNILLRVKIPPNGG